jgi:hypothetical protein
MAERESSPSATSGKGRDPGYKETVPDPAAEEQAREFERQDAEVAARSKNPPVGPGESGTLVPEGEPDNEAGTSFDGGTPEDGVNSTPDGETAPEPGEDADETDSSAVKASKRSTRK